MSSCFLVCLSAGCANAPLPTGPRPDPALANATASARSAFDRGMTAEAAALYRRALDRARAMDDAAEIGNAAYNLAASLVQAGEYEQARTALLEAEVETARAGASLSDVLLLDAKAARLQGKTSEAGNLAERVLTDPRSRPTPAHRVQVHVLKGEVAAAAGEWDAADQQVRLARESLTRLGDAVSPALLAGLVGLRAKLAHGRGDPAAAAALYDRQADLLRQGRLYPDMVRALLAAGRSWGAAGNPAAAGPRFFRAARSAAAQGDAEAARMILPEAREAARQANDQQLLALIDALDDGRSAPSTVPAANGG